MVKEIAKKSIGTLGSWAFLIGVVIAVLFGLFGALNEILVFILIVLGIIVGLLNVTDKEVQPFLMAGAVLVIVSNFGQEVVNSIAMLKNVLQAISILFVPATIVVAIKHVFTLAKN